MTTSSNNPTTPKKPTLLSMVDQFTGVLLNVISQALANPAAVPDLSPKQKKKLQDELDDLLDMDEWNGQQTLRLSALFFVMTLISHFEARK